MKINSKCIVSMASVLIASSILLFSTSCKVDQNQTKEIAKNAGSISATTWIAIENPNSVVLSYVTNILLVVKEKALLLESGQTYIEVVYPELAKIINSEVEQQYQPLCKFGTLTLLGQLDVLFIKYPEWKQDQDLAIEVSCSFIDGAIWGLSLSETNPIMKELKINFIAKPTL